MAADAKPTYPPAREAARPDAERQARRAAQLPSAALFLGALFVYWATRTAYNTFDAVSYANQIGHLYPRTGDARWLFHPHHLLFNAVGWALWRMAGAVGYAGGPLVVLQSLNAILGAAGIVVFYLALRRLTQRSRGLPLLLALCLAVSYGYWVCATDGRVNMASVTLLLSAFAVLCGFWHGPTARRAAGLGALAGLAVLFHQSAGLFLPVALVGIGLAPQNPMVLPALARRRKRRQCLVCLGAWAAVVAVPYLLVGLLALGLRSPGEFRAWMTSYAALGYWWDFDVWHNLRLDAAALRGAAFVEPPGHRGTFHLSRDVPTALRALYWSVLGGWLLAVWAFLLALPLLWRSHHRRVLVACLIWIGLYGAFFTVWNPGYFVFWVPVLIPISVLLALAASHYRARRGGIVVNYLIGIWLVMCGALNLAVSLGPHLNPATDPFRRAAADVRAHTQAGDLIVLAGMGEGAQCEVDIPYFADRDVLSVHSVFSKAREDRTKAEDALRAQIAQTWASGHAVYAFNDLWHLPRARKDLAKHGLTPRSLSALFEPYDKSPAWTGPRGPVWRLTPVGYVSQEPVISN